MLSPSVLSRYFSRFEILPLPGGASGARVSRLSTNAGEFILKQQEKGDVFQSLFHEVNSYQWLQGRMPVPEVIGFGAEDNTEWLCMSMLAGSSLEDLVAHMKPEAWVGLFAETLCTLHAIPLDGAAPLRSLDEYLFAARRNMESGRVDLDNLQEENKGIPLPDLYQRMVSLRPRADIDPVFMHGDYCPGNIIYSEDGLSGLIDLGRGGVGDRHHDIALALRFIRDDLDPALCDLFLRIYGWAGIDPNTLAFFELLDEFF